VALAPGTRLGAYEVVSLLGEGGMGQVYRAKDTKLNRDVALKILPEVFAVDGDRIARFRREAQVLAALNHSHIGAIYGFEDSGSTHALVLELVEGPTLADRIAKGPLPLNEAQPIARQIAEALEAAHEQGIIHRDLKPANIKLRPDGTVKVLDFGLAKALEPASSARVELTRSPTITTPAMMTGMGTILGTAAYMSPEQARGRPVDRRTDVWAFGCVLFEMLTGQRPFDGEDTTAVLARIIEREPDWRALPPGTPSTIHLLLARCLRKDLAQRLRDITDARFLIEDALAAPATSAVVPSRRRDYREWAAWSAAAVCLGIAASLAWLHLAARLSPAASGASMSFSVFPPDKAEFSGADNTTVSVPSFALSPDGRALVYAARLPGARPLLWLRSMDQVNAHPLAGTEGAQNPIWSPDANWIAFFADGKVKKIPAAGGAVQTVAQTNADFRGASWGTADTILFAAGAAPMMSVNSAGGTVTPVTRIDPARHEASHRNPQMLPDGRHFLYSIFGASPDVNGIYVGSLDGNTKKQLIHVSTNAVYADPGYVLFVDGDTLLGQRFDPARAELEGQPFLVAEHVGRDTAFMSAVSASATGTVAYAGPIVRGGGVSWIDRRGGAIGPAGTPDGDYVDFRLSPDEKRLSAAIANPATNSVEVWIADFARRTSTRVASGGPVTASALWSPDGSRLVFRSNRNGLIEFYERSAAGGGNDKLLLSGEAYATARIPSFNLVPTDWSPDGRQIVFSAPAPESGNDLWLFPVADARKTAKFLASPAEEMHGNFSPDGGLIAYTSNESGKFEVYVETVPRTDRKWPLSTNGGYEPRWRADGREIYYLSDDRKLMAVSVGPGPVFGVPQALFQTHVPGGANANRTHYVPSHDGNRFLMSTSTDAAASPITVVVNWTAALKK
jgi:serine/threonine protein kinase/Tol biopolymer transport system component